MLILCFRLGSASIDILPVESHQSQKNFISYPSKNQTSTLLTDNYGGTHSSRLNFKKHKTKICVSEIKRVKNYQTKNKSKLSQIYNNITKAQTLPYKLSRNRTINKVMQMQKSLNFWQPL